MMNQNETTQILKLTLVATAMIVLTSCSNTKVTEDATTNTNTFSSTANKALASCNKTKTTDISLSTAAILGQTGQQDNNWLKLKFNFLSAKATAAGNVVKFFRWKMNYNSPALDQAPLSFYTYNISNGTSGTTAGTQITASTVSSSVGYNVYLNDSQGTYQVIKAVVYNSAGEVVAQADSLIPQFMAKTSDYAYNWDGSARSTALQALHPLNGVSTAGWNDAAFTSYFQAFCF